MAEAFIGEIRMFGGSYAPHNWALCHGQLLAISQYQALYSLIGTYYGGNGITTFALPDFRGRVPVHQGQGPGLTYRAIGSRVGQEEVTLDTTQIPSHTHVPQATSNSATSISPENQLWATIPNYDRYTPSVTDLQPMSDETVGATGGNAQHNNLMPYLALTFIIALQGTYPSRN